MDDEKKGLSKLVRSALAGSTIKAVILCAPAVYMLSGEPAPQRVEQKPAVIEKKIEVEDKAEEVKEVKKESSLDEILSRHCVIEEIVNPGGKGNIYLVGTQNNVYIRNSKNEMILVADVDASNVQGEIYQLLVDVFEETDLGLVMGQGIGPRELIASGKDKYVAEMDDLKQKMKDMDVAVQLFAEKKALGAHQAFEMIYQGEIKTYGFDDRAGVKVQNKLYGRLLDEHIKYKEMKDPHERELSQQLVIPLMADLDKVRRTLSKVRMIDSVRRANHAGEEDVFVTVAAHNAPEMVETYKEILTDSGIDRSLNRSLYMLRPNSISKESFFAAKNH